MAQGDLLGRLGDMIGRHKTLFRNFSFLSVLQFFNLGLPLLTYPYLIRVMGVPTYGLVILARAGIEFFIMAIDFGFNVPSARSVSIHRHDPDKLSEIVSAIFYLKIAIFGLCFLLLIVLVSTVPQLASHRALYLLTMVLGLEGILYPIWFFQGQEKMQFITYVEITSKLTFAGLIFVFIQGPEDYLWYPALQGIGTLAGGIFSCSLIVARFKIRLQPVKFSILGQYLWEGRTFFLSKVAATIQERTNTLMAGAFLGTTEVAYYDLANKVIGIAKIPFYILNETIYPHVARQRDMGFVKKVIVASFAFSVLLYLAIAGSSRVVIMTLAGKELLASQPLFFLLGLILPVIGVSYLLGNNMLVVMGHGRQSNFSEIFSTLFFLITVLILYLCQWVTMVALIVAYLAANLFTLLYRLYYCRTLKLL